MYLYVKWVSRSDPRCFATLSALFNMKPSACTALSVSSLLFCTVVLTQSTCNTTASQFPILIEATTESLETGLESGLFTSVDLVNAYIARILEVNTTLHVITELNPDALSIAAVLDAERANGTTRGPLRKYLVHMSLWVGMEI